MDSLLTIGSRIYKQSKYSGLITKNLVIKRLTKTMTFSENDSYKFKIRTFSGLTSLISMDNNDKSFYYVLETETETLKQNFIRQNFVIKLKTMDFK